MGIAGIVLLVAAALATGGDLGGRASAMPATVPAPPAGERAAREFRGSVSGCRRSCAGA